MGEFHRKGPMLKKSIIGISVLFFLFMGLSRFLGIGEGGIETGSSVLLYPFLRVQKVLLTPYEQWKASRQSVKALLRDLENSLQAQEKLQQEVIHLKALVHYTENSQEIRDFLERYTHSSARIVRVLLKNFDGFHFFLIDGGTSQGIEKDMIAVYKDCLIGRVTEVYPYYSKVVLITDRTCKVAAYCPQTNTQGVHEGINLLDLTLLNYVNHLDQVKEGDMVLSSGEGLIFPRGFGLGRVKQREYDGLQYSITVTPLVDFKNIHYCALVSHGVLLSDPQDQKIEA